MRQSRKARRHRTAVSGPPTFNSVESFNRQTAHLASVQLAAAAHQWDRLKLLSILPAHMIIPPGTNVSVPPPPLPIFPPNISLMRFPLRHLFMKTPPPPNFSPYPRLFNPYLTAADKNAHEPPQFNSSCSSENAHRAKIQMPPPPLFPMALRPPATPPFLENSTVPPPAPQDFKIFAEHTIKAALGITPGSPVQLRNY